MICGNNLNYGPEYFVDVRKALRELNKDEWNSWVKAIFTARDAESLIQMRNEAEENGGVFKLPLKLNHTRPAINISSDVRFVDKTVTEYFADYGGNPKSDTEDLQTNVSTEMVFTLVYNPETYEYFRPNDTDVLHPEYNQLNYKLREKRKQYAEEVIRELDLKELENYKYNFDDDFSFSTYINVVLAYAQNEIIKRQMRNSITPSVRTAFIKLACFDELILNSGFIQYNINADQSLVISKDKYIFTGETIDYGKSMFEEHADSEDYTSKLIKIILDSVDCLDYSGNPTVKLGLKGFNEAMTTVINWAKSGENATAFKLITDPDSRDYAKIIDLYLNSGKVLSRAIRFALKGIRKSLFNEQTPVSIKQMFNAQADTTVKAVYLEYSLGSNKKKQNGRVRYSPAIVVKEATSKISDRSKNELVDLILFKLNYLSGEQGSKAKSDFEKKYQVKWIPNTEYGKPSVLEFRLGNKAVEITYNPIKKDFNIKGVNWDINSAAFNSVWAGFINQLLDLPLMNEDVYEFLSNNSIQKTSLYNAFEDTIAATMWCLFAAKDKQMFFKDQTGKWNRSSFYKHVDKSSTVLNRIMGDELSVIVTDQNGHKLPLHQMVSLAYRTANLIADIRRKKDKGVSHVLSDNIFIGHPEVIEDTVLRESISVNSQIKKSSELNTSELLQISHIVDYYNSLKNDKTIYIQPMTYSDKSRHLLYKLNLGKIKIGERTVASILEGLNSTFKYKNGVVNQHVEQNENLLYEEIRLKRYTPARKTLIDKINRFSSALDIVGLQTETDVDILAAIDLINKRLQEIKLTQKNPIRYISDLFYNKNIDFYLENDIDRDFGLNKMAIFNFQVFADIELTKKYFDKIKLQYIKDLVRSGYEMNRFLDPTLKQYFASLDSTERKNWIDENTGTMSLYQFRDKSGKIISDIDLTMTDNDLLQIGTIELNPMLNGHFLANALFGEQLRALQMGADYNIASKGSDVVSDIESRFIAESKRAMGQGSTVLKFDTTRKFGISTNANIAVYDDLTAPVYNPQGDNKEELVADGGGYISPIQAILESWSLPGNSRLKIDVVKSILQCIDDGGNLLQIKWAGTTLSNRRRRNAPHNSEFSLDEMFRKMHNKKIFVNFDISQFYGDFVTIIEDHTVTCSEKLYFKHMSRTTDKLQIGKHYRINSVFSGSQLNTGVRNLIEVDSQGNVIPGAVAFDETFTLDSLSAIHEFFGGIWCKVKSSSTGELEYSEINHEILANIACVHDLKDVFTHYNVNKSSMKVGMHNINASTSYVHAYTEADDLREKLAGYYSLYPHRMPSYFNGSIDAVFGLHDINVLRQLADQAGMRTDLWTFNFNMSHSGVQLDSGHSIEGGKVTEMSQLVNLLVEKGYCTDIVDSIYNDIARVTDAGMLKFKGADVRTIVSELLIDSLTNTSSSINTITDDFIKHLQTRAKEEGIDLEVPFSTPSIREKFATSICAAINTAALRRKYAGIGAVQTPSYGQMMTARIGDYYYSFEEIIDLYSNAFESELIHDVNDLFYDKTAPSSQTVTKEYVDAMKNCINNEGIPVMSTATSYEIDFEETYVIAERTYDENGIEIEPALYEVVTTNDISKYDQYRHSNKYIIYKWNTKPNNLKQALNYYRTDTGKFTMYDFDEYRISAYLSHPEVWQTTRSEYVKGYLAMFGIDFDTLADNERNILVDEYLKKLQLKLRSLDEDEIKTININGAEIFVTDMYSDGAEVIIDYPYKKEYNIRDSDRLSDIIKGGSVWFANRLSERFIVPVGLKTNSYDAILYTNEGEPIIIQFGTDTENQGRFPAGNLMIGNTFTKNTGKLRYKGEDLGDSNGVSEFIYNEGGVNYKVLRLENPAKLNELRNSKLFSEVRFRLSQKSNAKLIFEAAYKNKIKDGIVTSTFRIGEVLIKKGSKIDDVFAKYHDQLIPTFNKKQNDRINDKIQKLAVRQNKAFLKTLEALGTRIPSQTLQSCSKIKIIGFSGSGMNDVYVPRILTWVAGSDYDIDKFFIMMYSINSDGTLPNIYGIDHEGYDPTDLAKLVPATGEEFDILVSSSTGENEIVITKDDIDAVITGGQTGIDVINRIIEARKNSADLDLCLWLDDSEFAEPSAENVVMNTIMGRRVDYIDSIFDQSLKNNVLWFLDILNSYSTNDPSKYAKSYREAAERNNVLSGMCKALSTNAVQIGLQTPVSVQKAHRAANRYGQKKINVLTWDNPYSIFKQQYDNMVGKIGIAAVAVANKAFNGISFSFNITANNLAQRLESLINSTDNIDTVDSSKFIKDLLSICIPLKNGNYASLANIDWRRLKKQADIIKFIPIDISIYRLVDSDKYIENNQFNIKLFVDDLYEFANRTDVNDLFSNIMSAATDNAKELLLAKLNAVGNNIDLYTYLFSTGYNFDEAAEIMLSREFLLVSDISKSNIFEHDSNRIRLDNTIKYIQKKGYLPTVDATILKSIFTEKPNSVSFLEHALKHVDKEFKKDFIAFINDRANATYVISDDESELQNSIDSIFKSMRSINSPVLAAFTDSPENEKITYLEQFMISRLSGYTYSEAYWEVLSKWLSSKIASAEQRNIFDDYDDREYDDGADPMDDDIYGDGSGYVHKKLEYKEASADQLRNIYRYLNKTYIIYNSIADVDDIQFQKLLSLTKAAEEFATLGRKIFSSNQGMKVGEYESWSWIRQINTDINKKLSEKLSTFIEFDFVAFMKDDPSDAIDGVPYSVKMIEQYDTVKENVNILKVVKDSPHFKSMLNAIVDAESILENSFAIKLTRDLASKVLDGVTSAPGVGGTVYKWLHRSDRVRVKKLFGNKENKYFDTVGYSLSNDEWKALVNVVNEHIIMNFFMHLNTDDVRIPLLKGQIDKHYIQNYGSKVNSSDLEHDSEIKLNTVAGLATFKRWMDNFFIPLIKDVYSSGNQKEYNAFVDMLCLTEIENKTFGTKKYAYSVNKNIRQARPGELLYKKKAEVVSDFNKIMQTKIFDLLGNAYKNCNFTIGDLFYLYNLSTFKDSGFGFNFLFADAAASGNKSDWVNNFQRYILDVDRGKTLPSGESSQEKLIEIDIRDVFFKLVNSDNAWKFKGRFDPEGKIYFKTYDKTMFEKPLTTMENSDFVFEIPSVYEKMFVPIVWEGFNPHEYFKTNSNGGENRVIKATGQEVLHEILSGLNTTLQVAGIQIEEITNEDIPKIVKEHGLSQDQTDRIAASRGFVLNGKIYINTSDELSGGRYNPDSNMNLLRTLMHELVHVIAANLHYNPKYRDSYYELIRSIWEGASEEERNAYLNNPGYDNKRTTDLMEEFFADKIAEAFAANFSDEFGKRWNERMANGDPFVTQITADRLRYDVVSTIKEVFKLDDSIDSVDLSKLGGTDITQICHMFKSALFDFNKLGFNTTTVVLSQTLATVKNQLMKDYKIVEDCH